MPKAVAVLEGDSTDLVQSIEKAKGAMQKLEGEGRKLTDQLRDVADEADKAAGSLVNKIGGPRAVKAIAGITAGYAAAQQAVDMFMESSEKLFSSYGANGQALWDELQKQLTDIQGGFAKAVLQTDDLYLAYGRIYAVLELVKDMSDQLVESTILGINLLRKIPGTWADLLEKMGFFDAFDAMAKEGEARAKELVKNMDKSAKSFAKPLEAAKTFDETIKEMTKSYAGLTGSSVSFEEQRRQEAISNIDGMMAQIEAMALLQNQADNMSGDNVGGLTDEQIERLERLQKLKDDVTKGGKVKAVVETAGKTGAKDEETAAERANRVLERRLTIIAQQREIERQQAEERASLITAETDRWIEDQRRKWAEEDAAEARKAKTEEKNKRLLEERDAKWEAENQAKIDGIQAVGKEYAQLAADQIATGEKASKIAEKLARKAIGGQISALGDEAMAKAAIYAAALNPLAIPMAAAGVAAYAAAAALGSDSKKAASSTPAAAAPVQAAPVNTSFNLRVDAAFADGESIARQFAMMQQSAQRRGLVPRGAY